MPASLAPLGPAPSGLGMILLVHPEQASVLCERLPAAGMASKGGDFVADFIFYFLLFFPRKKRSKRNLSKSKGADRSPTHKAVVAPGAPQNTLRSILSLRTPLSISSPRTLINSKTILFF